MAAYKRLYINVESNNSRSASTAIAQNLIALVVGETEECFVFCLNVGNVRSHARGGDLLREARVGVCDL